MEKKEFVKKLKKYTKEHGFTIYDYYLFYAETIRLGSKEYVQDPFLTDYDYKLLIESKDPQISEHFAAAMAKVIALQEEEDVLETDSYSGTDSSSETTHQDAVLSKDDIREVINEKLDEIYSQEKPSQEESLTREDIEEVIDEELDSIYSQEKPSQEESLTREVIREVIDEKLRSLSSMKVKITSIGRKIADLLSGFAVIKEEKTGRTHLYHYDAQEDSLTGERLFINNQLKVGSGYYVNYQDYLDHMLRELVEKYPTSSGFRFIRDDGVIMTFNEVLEEAYSILVKNGALLFGKELCGKTFPTFRDYKASGITGIEEYAGKPLKVGIYVRRDILTRIFAKFKIQVNVSEDSVEKQSVK